MYKWLHFPQFFATANCLQLDLLSLNGTLGVIIPEESEVELFISYHTISCVNSS